MTAQVVPSRMQNRRGTQAEFDALYLPTAPDSEKLQPGEIGFCTDTHRVFIGNEIVELVDMSYTEISISSNTAVVGDALEFTPVVVSLPPAASWTAVTSLAFTPNVTSPHPGVLNIIYSIIEETPPSPSSIPFTKSGTLTVATTAVTSTSVFIPTATLTDNGTEINTYPATQPDISFMASYTGGTVQILYMHDFAGSLELSTSTIHWVNF